MALIVNVLKKILFSCLFIFLTGCGNSSVEIAGGLSKLEVRNIASALSAVGIVVNVSENRDGESTIFVDKADEKESRSLLHDQGLPRKRYDNLGDVFKKDGLFSSPLEERARYVHALGQQLEESISNIDGVMYVTVHPVLPKRASLIEEETPASAGVLIKYDNLVEFDRIVPEIRQFVARSIPNLEIDRVSVVVIPTSRSTLINNTENRLMNDVPQRALPLFVILLLAFIVCAALSVFVWWYLRTRRTLKPSDSIEN
ncbi:hypothetical protein ACVBEF_14875 [Glaciimonas sp. GG7]